MRWYEFEDESRSKIKASYSHKPPSDDAIIDQLDESDERVQEWIGPAWSRPLYQEYEITSIEELIVVSNACSFSNPRWGFRGQPNYDDELMHALERDIDFEFRTDVGLSRFERRILGEAKRRAHLYHDVLPADEDVLGWYSFLRHQGVPTRLLDITWSIFVAAYFSVSSSSDKDGALWAFNQFNLDMLSHNSFLKNTNTMFYANTGAVVIDGYQGPTVDVGEEQGKEYNASEIVMSWRSMVPTIFDLSTQGHFNLKGIMFAEPSWLSKRQDAQQGAFLFPLNCRVTMQENLMSLLEVENLEHSKPSNICTINSAKEYIKKIRKNSAVIKFRIPNEYKNKIKNHLDKMNIRTGVLFPDNEGFVGYLKDLVPKK